MKICGNKRSRSLFDLLPRTLIVLQFQKPLGQFHIEPTWAERRKGCSNSSGHRTSLAAMPIHGINLYKSSSLEPVD